MIPDPSTAWPPCLGSDHRFQHQRLHLEPRVFFSSLSLSLLPEPGILGKCLSLFEIPLSLFIKEGVRKPILCNYWRAVLNKEELFEVAKLFSSPSRQTTGLCTLCLQRLVFCRMEMGSVIGNAGDNWNGGDNCGCHTGMAWLSAKNNHFLLHLIFIFTWFCFANFDKVWTLPCSGVTSLALCPRWSFLVTICGRPGIEWQSATGKMNALPAVSPAWDSALSANSQDSYRYHLTFLF